MWSWDPATGTQVGEPLRGHTSAVSACCALPRPDGTTLLVTASWDRTVRLWNPATGTHSRLARSVAQLLSASRGDARMAATMTPVGPPMRGHTDGVTGCCAIPVENGTFLLATTGRDETVRVWDPATGIQVGHR
ncbi:conserved hypothetical protein [Nostocoides australiense Ben110]|uniref:WD-40 repeat protein n=1 Tax=Nostocoides australiense Ben110 TaxID=1193182 RepID=W6K4G6_9MICO|nr:conserved hypothetical protein [Tetrasphaera australiensis Ben110]